MSPQNPTLLTIAGTRPEVIKLAPVIRILREDDNPFVAKTCFSGQHREILESVLGDLDVVPDVDFRAASHRQSLPDAVGGLLTRLTDAISHTDPDGVLVQGDTNSALAGAMAAFYRHLPIFHVEAGLRTADPMLPFPEEMNRRLISRMARLHFAPTTHARDNLLADGISADDIFTTGNTGIDTLRLYAGQESKRANALLEGCREGSKRLLVTLHRRENKPLAGQVTAAMRRLVETRDDVEILWLMHLNGIQTTIERDLGDVPEAHLFEPQPYRCFVHLMKAADIILTDSGGVQEEAPALGRPVLVLRDETERPEAVTSGNARVIGCHTPRIISAAEELLDDADAYERMTQPSSPFGDGHASERILAALGDFYGCSKGNERSDLDLPAVGDELLTSTDPAFGEL